MGLAFWSKGCRRSLFKCAEQLSIIRDAAKPDNWNYMRTRVMMKTSRMVQFLSLRNLGFRISNVHETTNAIDVLMTYIGRPVGKLQAWKHYSNATTSDYEIIMGSEKMSLAENLACLLEESSKRSEKTPMSRMELKRYFELRIKKRVKEQFRNGIYQNLMNTVIADPYTLKDAYSCILLNSNAKKSLNNHSFSFESLAEELSQGSFDVSANTFTISTKGARKEVLVFPNIKLKVIQEAIKIVLEVIYRPYFSKISHGCRSGRGHMTALKYIKKEISNPDWWFTIQLNKKMDGRILAKLISIMEEKLQDQRFYAIIQSMFDSQVLNVEFGGFPKGHGLPQEGVLSPIFLNIYLDRFDSEFYRLSMKREALEPSFHVSEDSHSKLRSWFRRQMKGSDPVCTDRDYTGPIFHCCRFMDEIIVATSGSKDVAVSFRNEILEYLQSSLQLDVDDQIEILPSRGPHGIRFLGAVIKRSKMESPAVRAVHKLQEKVQLFASQKQEAWDSGTVRIGKKWLAHGLKKVKETEIKHLADSGSTLSQISRFRKVGMKTDHWYKHLLKIWMDDIQAKSAENEEFILSKYVAEPAIPQELKDSFFEFQRLAQEYTSTEAAATLALLPNSGSSSNPVTVTQIIAPVNSIMKRLSRYGLATSAGYPRSTARLILQDDDQIINWFSGIIRRWLKWYCDFDNFSEIKLLIVDQVRKSCICTLAAKYRIHESEIGKKFDLELSEILSTEEIEQEMSNETTDFDNDEALMYGISYSGVCLLSLARIVSRSRPCNCFVLGCDDPAPHVYTLHVMERQKFPGWKTGFSSCIHPSLNRRRVGLCKQHVKDLYLGHISLSSVEFGAWKRNIPATVSNPSLQKDTLASPH